MNLRKKLADLNFAIQGKAHQHIPNKIYFLGPARSGKTTFIKELQKRQDELHLLALDEHTSLNQLSFWEEVSKIEYSVFDTGGEDEFRVHWFDVLREDPPLGIIFVLDHENIQETKKDLKQILGALQKNKNNSPSKAITRGILIFVNKYDCWKKEFRVQQILEPIEDDISKFESIGIIPIIRYGSAKYYKKYPKLLDTSISDFHRLLFDRLTKVSKWSGRM